MPEEAVYWQVVGQVRRSSRRSRVLHTLETPYLPSELARELDMHQPNVGRALCELKEVGLVAVLNPAANQGRVYTRTDRGDEVVNQLPDP